MRAQSSKTLKKRTESAWEIDNLEKLEEETIKPYRFSEKTLNTFCKIGLPKWCAPNMHLHPRDGFAKFHGDTNGVHIGIDRDERLICLNRKTESVYALDFDGRHFSVARNIEEFLQLLVAYAEFIEGYLSANTETDFSDGYPDKNTAQDLISNLRKVSPKLLQDYDWWAKHFELPTQ